MALIFTPKQFNAMIIPIASDHAGYPSKEIAKKVLQEMGYEVKDFGTHSEESVDYPDYAIEVAERVNKGEYETGVLVCGSGQGVCMTANKFPDVRAGLAYSKNSAELTRQHNNANVICLPGRELNESQIREILSAWFSASFEGGRHERRVNKIKSLTQK